jgi:hypothetical protein
VKETKRKLKETQKETSEAKRKQMKPRDANPLKESARIDTDNGRARELK